MSGGHYQYACYKVEDMASKLMHSRDPLRRTFAKHLDLVARAMHDIEWVDSGDYGDGDDVEAIKNALGVNADQEIVKILKEDAQEIIDKLKKFL